MGRLNAASRTKDEKKPLILGLSSPDYHLRQEKRIEAIILRTKEGTWTAQSTQLRALVVSRDMAISRGPASTLPRYSALAFTSTVEERAVHT